MDNNTAPAAIATEDGHAIIGGRTSVLYEGLTQFDQPMAPENRRGSNSRVAAEVPVMGEQPPMLHVAQQVLGKEIGRLKAVEAAIEMDIARGPFGASGAPNPYLVQRMNEQRSDLEHVRAEVERLESLSDDACRQWAFDRGVR